jgi:hypothetical protein
MVFKLLTFCFNFVFLLKIQGALSPECHNIVHNHLVTLLHMILKLEIGIAIRMLGRSLHWLGLWHH